MYDDDQLSAEDAWTAMARDLRDTKRAEKKAAQENA